MRFKKIKPQRTKSSLRQRFKNLKFLPILNKTSTKRKRQIIKPIKEDSKREKKYFISFVLAILFWAGAAATVMWSAPATVTIVIFFIFLTMALGITLSILFANSRRGLLATGVIIIFLILRAVGLGNILNLILLIGAAISFELYHRG